MNIVKMLMLIKEKGVISDLAESYLAIFFKEKLLLEKLNFNYHEAEKIVNDLCNIDFNSKHRQGYDGLHGIFKKGGLKLLIYAVFDKRFSSEEVRRIFIAYKFICYKIYLKSVR